jgi:hypothetical protein
MLPHEIALPLPLDASQIKTPACIICPQRCERLLREIMLKLGMLRIVIIHGDEPPAAGAW